jgi:hypothetical protein
MEGAVAAVVAYDDDDDEEQEDKDADGGSRVLSMVILRSTPTPATYDEDGNVAKQNGGADCGVNCTVVWKWLPAPSSGLELGLTMELG